jgi:hypothetical protein
MCKRLFLLASFILLLVGAPSVFGEPIGVFNFSDDVGTPGNPSGTGGTRYVATNEYLILAGGSDIWDNADHFHYAYNQVSGNVRFELSPAWDLGGGNDWAKIETMLRVNTGAGSVTYATATRRGNTDPANKMVDAWVGLQARSVENDWMWGAGDRGGQPSKIAIQRVVSGDYQLVQSLVDYGGGSGWETVSNQVVPGLPDQLLMGAAVTSHDNYWLVQARVGNVAYTQNPDVVGAKTTGDPLADRCGDTPGFLIRSLKPVNVPGNWGYAGMADLLDGVIAGMEEGSRIEQFVNLHDSGGRGNFGNDQSFPGIDGFEQPTSDPAGTGLFEPDDDDSFATEVLACIYLTQGLHIIGANSDDGTIIDIGGVEVARTGEWKGADNQDFLIIAPADGFYSFRARNMEGGGGASLELTEILASGVRVLMGDVANGASPVYVPEPATIALLGFGGLAMLRVRRKR